MAAQTLGNVLVIYRGAYDPAATYQNGHVAAYGGDTYLCISRTAVQGVPPVANGAVESAYWVLAADNSAARAAAESANAAAAAAEAVIETGAGFLWREAAGNPLVVYPIPESLLHVRVNGLYTQDGEGTPSPENVRALHPWLASGDGVTVRRSGKNLIEDLGASATISGLTFVVNADGSITINGTSTATVAFRMQGDYDSTTPIIRLYAGIPYTLSKGANLVNGDLRLQYRTMGGRQIYQNTGEADVSVTFTPDEDVDITEYYVLFTAGQTVSNVTIFPQLEPGSAATDYEPYAGEDIALAAPADSWGGWLANDGTAENEYGSLVLDGSRTWAISTVQPTDTALVRFGLPALDDLALSAAGAADRFVWETAPIPDHEQVYSHPGGPYLGIILQKSRLTGWSDSLTEIQKITLLKSWLAENHTRIVYELDEPVGDTLTGAALMALAQADRVTPRANAVTANTGTVTLQYTKSPIRESDELRAAITTLGGGLS